MKLKTELHLTKVLHVEVPESIDTSEFETDIGIAVRDGEAFRLKDGITVSPEMLADSFEPREPGDWHETVEPFIQAVLDHEPSPDEFFFHR